MADDPTDGAPFRKLSYDELVKHFVAKGYSKAGAEGWADNVMRESGGDPTKVGDSRTSIGLFQHHADRKDALEAFAKSEGKDWRNPSVQLDFQDKEVREQYPKLQKQLMAETDRGAAEEAIKRIYERPKSVMWEPTLGTPRYRISDYALSEHDGRRNTSIVYMDPGDYLALSPDLEDEPFTSRSGKALRKSFEAGDEIEAIPSLDLKVRGPTGTVTDQDGRHRALLAQEEGVDAIPVAMRRTGKGEPTEIEGMAGRVLPNDFKPASAVKRDPNPDGSVFGRIMDQVVPKAEAAEPTGNRLTPVDHDPFAEGAPAPATTPGSKLTPVDFDPFAQPAAGAGGAPAVPGAPALAVGANPMATRPAVPAGPNADNMLVSAAKGAAAGFGRTALSGQELLGKGLEAFGVPGGEWLVGDAQRGMANLTEATAADRAAHPFVTGAADLGGSMVAPLGIAGKIGGGSVRMSALSGGLSGGLQPGGEGDYWTNKAIQTGVGAGAGIATNALVGAASRAVVPTLRKAVQTLTGEGVQLTPGQLAGGAAKVAEDKAASIPIAGDAIRSAQRRSIEDFNVAAYNRVLAPIGEKFEGGKPGYEGVKELQGKLSAAYDRVLTGVRLQADQQLVADLTNLRTLVDEMPKDKARQFAAIVKNRVVHRMPTGTMDGETFKQVESELTTKSAAFHGSQDMADRQLGDALDEVNASLRATLERSNPGKQAELATVNRAWAMFARVRKAAGNRVKSEGIFTPADLLTAAKMGDRTAGKGVFARGDALMQDLGLAGEQVLPSKYPDSGTAGRLLMGEGALALFHHPYMALGALAGTLPYTAPASRLTNALVGRLAQAPGPTRNALAEILRRAGPTLAAPAGGSAAQQVP